MSESEINVSSPFWPHGPRDALGGVLRVVPELERARAPQGRRRFVARGGSDRGEAQQQDLEHA